MPSHQNPVGNSKAAKFVAANPLAPLADPFAGMVRQLLFVNAGLLKYVEILEMTIFFLLTTLLFLRTLLPTGRRPKRSTQRSIRQCQQTRRKGHGRAQRKTRRGHKRN